MTEAATAYESLTEIPADVLAGISDEPAEPPAEPTAATAVITAPQLPAGASELDSLASEWYEIFLRQKQRQDLAAQLEADAVRMQDLVGRIVQLLEERHEPLPLYAVVRTAGGGVQLFQAGRNATGRPFVNRCVSVHVIDAPV